MSQMSTFQFDTKFSVLSSDRWTHKGKSKGKRPPHLKWRHKNFRLFQQNNFNNKIHNNDTGICQAVYLGLTCQNACKSILVKGE